MLKQPFLLIEVLVALLLVSLCLVPLVRQPIQMFRYEIKKLEKMEKERLADWAFSEAKELFLKHEIPWNKIPQKGAKTGPFFLKDQLLQLPGKLAKKVPCHFFLTGRGAKTGLNGEDYRQVYMTLYVGDTKYNYRIPFQKQ